MTRDQENESLGCTLLNLSPGIFTYNHQSRNVVFFFVKQNETTVQNTELSLIFKKMCCL